MEKDRGAGWSRRMEEKEEGAGIGWAYKLLRQLVCLNAIKIRGPQQKMLRRSGKEISVLLFESHNI